MRKLLHIVILLCCFMSLHAQTQMVSVGLSVGGMTYPGVGSFSSIGLTVGGDIAFAALWPINRSFNIGIKTGVNVDYSLPRIEGAINDNYYRIDYLGNRMDYTIRGNVTYAEQNIRVAIPVMLAFATQGGMVLNLGIKNVLPISEKATQDVKNLNIMAYYENYGIEITNELITGLASEEQLHRNLNEQSRRYALGISAEIGYMASFRRGHRLGLLAFVDYLPFYVCSSTYSSEKSSPMVDVAPITNPANPIPMVTIRPFTSTITTWQSLSFGVKLVYGFNLGHKHSGFLKKSKRCMTCGD